MAAPPSVYRYCYLTLSYSGTAPTKIDVVLTRKVDGGMPFGVSITFVADGSGYTLSHLGGEPDVITAPECKYDTANGQVIISLGYVDLTYCVVSRHLVRFY